MNREILFRAKCSGVWRYGYYVHFDKPTKDSLFNERYNDFIITNGEKCAHYYPITDISSICQYTGLTDKNGNKIFEGDIIQTPRGNIGMVIFGKAEETVTHYVFRRKVTDVYTTYGWVFERIKDGYKCAVDDSILDGNCIGNIHDNPELLKGGER